LITFDFLKGGVFLMQGAMVESIAVMGPVIGGIMFHSWIDLVVFILSIYAAIRLGKAQLIQPFVLMIGLGALLGFLIMVARQPMWVASTARSILFLLAIAWLSWIVRPRKVSGEQSNLGGNA